MAKAQKRSNREIRKPKMAKPAPAADTANLLGRTQMAAANPPKKKR